MTQRIPVNPQILRWARETAGLASEEVARRLHRKSITAETIVAWEAGADSPTYTQLETLAYDIYRRPLALFFFPEPPQEETPRQSFRTLPEQEINRLSHRLRYLLRQAQSMRLSLSELHEGANPANRQMARDLRFAPGVRLSQMVTAVRKYLNVELSAQFNCKRAEDAFNVWRNAFEEHGVFVFKDAFRDDAISGFCLYDDRFPLIYVNNSKPATRQIFTLFHELSHLMFATGGIDTRLEDYIDFLRGDDRRIEVLCNRFAGAFLVPDEDFDRRIASLSIDEESTAHLAALYCVSREVILRKLLDRGLVSQQFYEQEAERWKNQAGAKTGERGDYYRTKGVYLGERYLQLVFSRHYQNRISIDQLADYLGVKVKYVPGMEALVTRHGGAA